MVSLVLQPSWSTSHFQLYFNRAYCWPVLWHHLAAANDFCKCRSDFSFKYAALLEHDYYRHLWVCRCLPSSWVYFSSMPRTIHAIPQILYFEIVWETFPYRFNSCRTGWWYLQVIHIKCNVSSIIIDRNKTNATVGFGPLNSHWSQSGIIFLVPSSWSLLHSKKSTWATSNIDQDTARS